MCLLKLSFSPRYFVPIIYIFHANVIYDGIVVYEFGDRLISDVMEMKSIYNVRPLRC